MDCLKTSDIVAPVMHNGEIMIGTMFVGPDQLRRIRNPHGVYFCDSAGRKIMGKSILRPPSWSESAWGDLTSQALRLKAWDD